MITYKISNKNPLSHIIEIEASFPLLGGEEDFYIHLPAWRPGRYEIANFSKNILNISAKSLSGEALSVEKVSKDRWKVQAKSESLLISYAYYAYQMDAGNSWADENQLYINPINCLVFLEGRLQEPALLQLEVPESYTIATGLVEISPAIFRAENYYDLVDSPIIASAQLQKTSYAVQGIDFHLWFQGGALIDKEKFKNDFKKFSEFQIKMMGSFPEKDYHFLFQVLPYSFRHGVEHRNSTVITIGPENRIPEELYADFLGISSHELFHAWNVIKIRPKELLPYDFTKENYFRTGYIAEGITTYYGDLFLVRSGVFSLDQYFLELSDIITKHFSTPGNYNLSLSDSSFDLWLDGYAAGVPGRKVSIYIKGAVVAFILDMHIRKCTSNTKSLDDVMRHLWTEFGFKVIGYSDEDFRKVTSYIAEYDLSELLRVCVDGTTDLQEELLTALDFVGLEILEKESDQVIERDFGIRLISAASKTVIDLIDPHSNAARYLKKNDEVIAINGQRPSTLLEEEQIAVTFFRDNKLFNVTINKSKVKHFSSFCIRRNPNASISSISNFRSWLGKDK